MCRDRVSRPLLSSCFRVVYKGTCVHLWKDTQLYTYSVNSKYLRIWEMSEENVRMHSIIYKIQVFSHLSILYALNYLSISFYSLCLYFTLHFVFNLYSENIPNLTSNFEINQRSYPSILTQNVVQNHMHTNMLLEIFEFDRLSINKKLCLFTKFQNKHPDEGYRHFYQ